MMVNVYVCVVIVGFKYVFTDVTYWLFIFNKYLFKVINNRYPKYLLFCALFFRFLTYAIFNYNWTSCRDRFPVNLKLPFIKSIN